jgi:hypothetical protein
MRRVSQIALRSKVWTMLASVQAGHGAGQLQRRRRPHAATVSARVPNMKKQSLAPLITRPIFLLPPPPLSPPPLLSPPPSPRHGILEISGSGFTCLFSTINTQSKQAHSLLWPFVTRQISQAASVSHVPPTI